MTGPQDKERTKALEQAIVDQRARSAATARILKTINTSKGDIQPVFEEIAQSAAEVCRASFCILWRYEGGMMHYLASHGFEPDFLKDYLKPYPAPPHEKSMVKGALDARDTYRIADGQSSSYYDPDTAEFYNFAEMMSVPVFYGEDVWGIIVLAWPKGIAPSDSDEELLKTFADQASLAIENARLVTETQKAVLREAASAEILEVVSNSTSDIQPVFDIIARKAAELCEAKFAAVWQRHGSDVVFRAGYGQTAEQIAQYQDHWKTTPVEGTLNHRVLQERKTIFLPDAQDPSYPDHAIASELGYRQSFCVPIFNGNTIWGTVVLSFAEGATSDVSGMGIVESFAEQASIAIENARLFEESRTALTRQTATSDILHVISTSPTDVQPVFEVIVSTATRLLGCDLALIHLTDGTHYWPVASAVHGGEITTQALLEKVRENARVFGSDGRPMFLVEPEHNFPSHAIKSKQIQHVPDWSTVDLPDHEKKRRADLGINSALYVPLMRAGACVGLLNFAQKRPRRFSEDEIALAESFRDQAMIALENTRLFVETQEALEQQTATSEVLKVISQSAFDLPTVLQALIEAAARLCNASICILFNRVDDALYFGANFGCSSEMVTFHKENPHRLNRTNIAGRAVLDAKTIHIPDIDADPEFDNPQSTALGGWKSIIAVPLIREGEVIGVLDLARPTAGPFSTREIELVESFADQAVIAINNTELFEEVQERTAEVTEALEYQTATSEVLGVISRSPNELTPVLDAILKVASRICTPEYAFFAMRDPSDGVYRVAIGHNVSPQFMAYLKQNPITPGEGSCIGRTALHGKTVHIADTRYDDSYTWKEAAQIGQYLTTLGVPLVKDGVTVGVIVMAHSEANAFSQKQIQLLETFAAQAVIAISNAQLFDEVQARTAEVTEALVREQASAEILQVINESTSDLQPMFDLIAQKSAQLCGASFCTLDRFDGEMYHLCAHDGFPDDRLHFLQRGYPFAHVPGHMSTRAMDSGQTEQIPNAQTGGFYDPELAKEVGFKRMLGVPIKTAGHVWGVIVLAWPHSTAPAVASVELVQSFASQASIAIENARLLQETQERTVEVTEALEYQTATSEVLEVISRSPNEVQPVLDAILDVMVRICRPRTALVSLLNPDTGRLDVAAMYNPNAAMEKILTEMKSFEVGTGTVTGRTGLLGKTICVENIEEDPDYEWHDAMHAGGFTSSFGVPLNKDGKTVGVISMSYAGVAEFSKKQVALAETFASQAVIAISNAKLFDELQARTAEVTESLEQQQATAEILSVISQSVEDTQPVFEKILDSCKHLFGGEELDVLLVDEEGQLQVAAYLGKYEDELLATFPAPWEITPAGEAIRTKRVANFSNVTGDPNAPRVLKKMAEVAGYHSVAFAPMIWEGKGIGVVGVARSGNPFSAKELKIMQSFADQAVIAIQNARLFKETQQALVRQTASADILRVISGAQTDVTPVFEAIVDAALPLLECDAAIVMIRDGDTFRPRAGMTPNGPLEKLGFGEVQIDPASNFPSQAIVSKKPVHIPDFSAVELPPHETRVQALFSIKSALYQPLMHGKACLGLIAFTRSKVKPFDKDDTELAEAFCSQAVIAIQNAKLFNETQTALVRQTASADILRVISGAQEDAQPVFMAIAEAGVQIADCDSRLCVDPRRRLNFVPRAWRVQGDADPSVTLDPAPVKIDSALNYPSRVIETCKMVHIPDFATADLPTTRGWCSGQVRNEIRDLPADDARQCLHGRFGL